MSLDMRELPKNPYASGAADGHDASEGQRTMGVADLRTGVRGGHRYAEGDKLALITLRPKVPMGAIQAMGYVCALGAVEALHALGVGYAAVGWPTDIADSRTYRLVARLRMHASYDRGMVVTCDIEAAEQAGLLRNVAPTELATELERCILTRIAAWEQRILAGAGTSGPLAPVLAEYFDAVALLGHRVNVLYPNGRLKAEGDFVGVDIWGRATVRTDEGEELEFPPEQLRIAPSQWS
jgi:BirA family biotin operon repressor/biotin-[acetyl-CoA-carboxylase] ligase